MVLIESGACRRTRWTAAREVSAGSAESWRATKFFFGADTVAGGESLGDQESVGRNAQARVMVEAAPAASFIVTQSKPLLEFLVVALDAPTHMRLSHQLVQSEVFGQRRQIVFEWLSIFTLSA